MPWQFEVPQRLFYFSTFICLVEPPPLHYTKASSPPSSGGGGRLVTKETIVYSVSKVAIRDKIEVYGIGLDRKYMCTKCLPVDIFFRSRLHLFRMRVTRLGLGLRVILVFYIVIWVIFFTAA